MIAAARRPGPGPVWFPGNPYPSLLERLTAFGRKNKQPRRPNQKKNPKGGSKVTKHPKGGK